MDDRTEMALLRRDYTPRLRSWCERYVAAVDQCLSRLDGAGDGPVSPGAELLQMVVLERRIQRIVIPSLAAPEYFGLPRSVTARAEDPDPTIRIQDPAREHWDFRPWLSEKVTYLQDNLEAVLEALFTLSGEDFDLETEDASAEFSDETPRGVSLEEDLRSADRSLTDEAPLPPEAIRERVLDRAQHSLRATRNYAREIINAVDTLGLTVIDWRLSGR